MFFWLKKIIAYWLMPVPFSLLLIVAGVALLLAARRSRSGRRLLLAGTVLLAFFSNDGVSDWLARPLESRYPPIPELRAGEPIPAALAACRYVVVLGGGHADTPGLSATNQLSISSLNRIVEGVRLLRVLPDATLIVSGPALPGHPSHASILAQSAASLGVDRNRIRLIDTARDTEDESLAVKKIAGDAPVALVTSAWHLPRAAALFRQAGVAFLPCPTDFISRPSADFRAEYLQWTVPALGRSDWAVHERLGYFWLWLRGRT